MGRFKFYTFVSCRQQQYMACLLQNKTYRINNFASEEFVIKFFTVCFRFVCKNNGVIYENQLLQIGLKSEYRQNLGETLDCTVILQSSTALHRP